MRIDEAVYLAAPRVKDAAMPTRRAFLIAGCTFSLGTAVGGACGYSLGAAATPSTPTVEDDLKPSGNKELDELRRLAVQAPISELLEKRIEFLRLSGMHYRNDAVLWSGVNRLADHVLENDSVPARGSTGRFIAQHIELADSPWRERYRDTARKLRLLK